MSLSGWEYLHFDSIDSTNLHAKRLAAQGERRDVLIRADVQSSGRGRLGRRWESPQGTGIWMTQLFAPVDVPAKDAGGAVFLSAIAMCVALRDTTYADVMIKWPNDLVLNGKKICGMLAECGFAGDMCDWIALGTGLNLNRKALPEELIYASGVEDETGVKIDPEALIERYLIKFDSLRDVWQTRGLEPIIELMRPLSATIGRDVRISGVRAFAVDIAPGGGLAVRYPDGREETVLAGDVSVRGITDYV